MDNAEGHACCPLGLCVELPTEMILQPVLHLSTCVPHKARFLNLTAEQGHVRPRTQFSESPLMPQAPHKWFGVRAQQVSSGWEAP